MIFGRPCLAHNVPVIATRHHEAGPETPGSWRGVSREFASGTYPAHQFDVAGAIRTGLADSGRNSLGVRSSLPPDVGSAVHPRRDRRAPRTGALRRPSSCRADHDRHPGSEPLGPKRISAWRAGCRARPPPLAVLRVPKIGLEVAVLPGTDDFTLNRAVGHIDDTALPGTDGNSGIAGHRDGFFRGLKDVGRGDAIEIETLQGEEVYHVERVWVVYPEDVSVLDATATRSLTLVTCYPFYHVGPAPQRYIVRAVRAGVSATRATRALELAT